MDGASVEMPAPVPETRYATRDSASEVSLAFRQGLPRAEPTGQGSPTEFVPLGLEAFQETVGIVEGHFHVADFQHIAGLQIKLRSRRHFQSALEGERGVLVHL